MTQPKNSDFYEFLLPNHFKPQTLLNLKQIFDACIKNFRKFMLKKNQVNV